MFVKNGDGDSSSKITHVIDGDDLTKEQKAKVKKKTDTESVDSTGKKSGS